MFVLLLANNLSNFISGQLSANLISKNICGCINMILMMPSNLETMSSSSNGSVEMKKTVLSDLLIFYIFQQISKSETAGWISEALVDRYYSSEI